MCNYNEKHDEFCLNTNIRLVGLISNFKLYINGNLLISNCINFSYIKNTLFITKSNNIIYIFSIDANNIVTKLDDFNLLLENSKTIRIGITKYIIDANCDITSHQ